jgi:hypothetical protein
MTFCAGAGDSGEDGLTPRDRVALQPNWQRILLIDAALGVAVVVAGAVVAATWSGPVGGLLSVLGLLYVVLGARRWRRWRVIRADHPDEAL